VTTGLTAAQTITVIGLSASAYGQEVDLAIDPGGDLLQIDPGGDVLIVTPGIMTFTGQSASIYGADVDLAIDGAGDLLLIDAGGDKLTVSPSAVVADRAVPLESEGWVYFETEGGQALESEGT